MTFFHCINCLILTYAPLVIFYQASNLNKLNQYGCLIKSLGVYMLSSLVKMLMAATLANVDTSSELSLINDLLYSSVNLVDALALKYLLNSYKFDFTTRWTIGEEVFSRMMPLIFYSRMPDVDYKWIQFSLDATCDLIFTISFSMSVWMALCAKGKMKPTANEFVLFAIHIVMPGVMAFLKNLELGEGWVYLIVHFVASLLLYGVGRCMFKSKSEAMKA
ncbi:uncharacterized protein [Blastocystis hominis]|uniref:BOS complex subunit TMEM147 n=1 Tax=Blastocystis hominis TaxID=12968 RepID=D8M051_BLAHO|nr:uncharacterized protein [Blastocystis hominis]CBK21440.2 unnamed protein product [Blastocystis hominis]|eukprot:XP_012895488.1 uncharacterized protein [Blastocystis hominis]